MYLKKFYDKNSDGLINLSDEIYSSLRKPSKC